MSAKKPKKRAEKTSRKVASVAARAIKEPEKATDAEVQALAASALTQVEKGDELDLSAPPAVELVIVSEAPGTASNPPGALADDDDARVIARALSRDLAAAHSRIATLETELTALQQKLEEQAQWYRSQRR